MSKKPSKTRTTAQEEIDQTRLDAKSFEAVRNLHLNWYNYALKALIGQMGKQLYEHLRPGCTEHLPAPLFIYPIV